RADGGGAAVQPHRPVRRAPGLSMTLLGRRGVLLLLLLAAAIVLPPYFGTYYTRFATQIAIYGMAALSIDLLLRYTRLIPLRPAARLYRAHHLRTGRLVRRRRICRRNADGLRRHRGRRGVAVRGRCLHAGRIGDRSAFAAHPRLPVHHGDARIRADGLLFRPEPAQLRRL